MNLLNPLYCLSKETKCALKWLSRATNLENNRHNENKKHLQLSISGEVISVNNIHLYKAVRIRFQEGPGRSLAMAKWTLLLFKSVLEQHVLLQNCYEAARVFAQPFLCLSPGCITTRAVSLQMSFSLNTGFLDTSKRNRIKRLTPIPDHAPELLKDCKSLSCNIMLTILWSYKLNIVFRTSSLPMFTKTVVTVGKWIELWQNLSQSYWVLHGHERHSNDG